MKEMPGSVILKRDLLILAVNMLLKENKRNSSMFARNRSLL
jgi:hypothetical protein